MPETSDVPSPVVSVARAEALLLRRWIGAWIDFIVVGSTWVLMFTILHAVFGANLPSALDGPIVAGVFLEAAIYFVITEGRWGRTVGKWVTRTIVVDRHARLPGYGKAAIRTLLRLVEVNPFLLGGIPAGLCVQFSPNRQRLGDMASGTFVISVKEWRRIQRHRDRMLTEVFS